MPERSLRVSVAAEAQGSVDAAAAGALIGTVATLLEAAVGASATLTRVVVAQPQSVSAAAQYIAPGSTAEIPGVGVVEGGSIILGGSTAQVLAALQHGRRDAKACEGLGPATAAVSLTILIHEILHSISFTAGSQRTLNALPSSEATEVFLEGITDATAAALGPWVVGQLGLEAMLPGIGRFHDADRAAGYPGYVSAVRRVAVVAARRTGASMLEVLAATLRNGADADALDYLVSVSTGSTDQADIVARSDAIAERLAPLRAQHRYHYEDSPAGFSFAQTMSTLRRDGARAGHEAVRAGLD